MATFPPVQGRDDLRLGLTVAALVIGGLSIVGGAAAVFAGRTAGGLASVLIGLTALALLPRARRVLADPDAFRPVSDEDLRNASGLRYWWLTPPATSVTPSAIARSAAFGGVVLLLSVASLVVGSTDVGWAVLGVGSGLFLLVLAARSTAAYRRLVRAD